MDWILCTRMKPYMRGMCTVHVSSEAKGSNCVCKRPVVKPYCLSANDVWVVARICDTIVTTTFLLASYWRYLLISLHVYVTLQWLQPFYLPVTEDIYWYRCMYMWHYNDYNLFICQLLKIFVEIVARIYETTMTTTFLLASYWNKWNLTSLCSVE